MRSSSFPLPERARDTEPAPYTRSEDSGIREAPQPPTSRATDLRSLEAFWKEDEIAQKAYIKKVGEDRYKPAPAPRFPPVALPKLPNIHFSKHALEQRPDSSSGTDVLARGNQQPLRRPLPLPRAPSPRPEGQRALPSFPADANVIHRDAMEEQLQYQRHLEERRRSDEQSQARINAGAEQVRLRIREIKELKAAAKEAIESSEEAREVIKAAFDQVERSLSKATGIMRKFETFEMPTQDIELIPDEDVDHWDEKTA